MQRSVSSTAAARAGETSRVLELKEVEDALDAERIVVSTEVVLAFGEGVVALAR